MRLLEISDAPTPTEQAPDRDNAVLGLAARTILFTDVRGSTQIIESAVTQTFFKALNKQLTRQSMIVRRYEGTVVKFTGDGLMASFQGFNRVSMALQCALAIQQAERDDADPTIQMPIGIGLCDGLVMCGYVGEDNHLGVDILGRPVHLAARLCGLARAGSVMLKKKDFEKADVMVPGFTDRGLIQVRGVKDPIECVTVSSESTVSDWAAPEERRHATSMNGRRGYDAGVSSYATH
jgi:adenylate cyclase